MNFYRSAMNPFGFAMSPFEDWYEPLHISSFPTHLYCLGIPGDFNTIVKCVRRNKTRFVVQIRHIFNTYGYPYLRLILEPFSYILKFS